jgi:MFS family permease
MLYLVSLLTDFTSNLLAFTMTRGLAELRTAAFEMGVIGTCVAAASTLCNPISGHLSDRFGRRIVALAGALLLFASLLTVYLLSVDHWGSLVAYALGGAAIGILYPPVIAWLSQGLTGRLASRAFLIFCIAFNLGASCGQQAAGYLYQHYGEHGPLLVGMFALVVIGAAIVTAKPPRPLETARAEIEEHAESERLLSAKFARIAWVANFGGTFSYSIVLYHFPRLAVSLGIPAEMHGSMLAGSRVIVLATFVAMHLSTFWRHRLWPAMLIQVIACCGLMLLAIAQSVALLTLGLSALAMLIGCNYFASLYYTTTGATAQDKGRASGIHEATLALGLTAGSLCGGIAGTWFTARAPFWLAAAVVGGLIFAQFVVQARLSSRVSDPKRVDGAKPAPARYDGDGEQRE